MHWVKLIFTGLLIGLWPAIGAAQVQSVGIAGDGEFTRITIVSEAPIEPDIFLRETVDGRVIEMVPAQFEITADAFFSQPTGGIYAYTLDTDRIVFELELPMMIMREIALPPSGSEPLYRYILDLSGVSATRFNNAAQRDERRFTRFEAARNTAAKPLPDPIEATPVEVADADTQTQPEAPTAKPASIGALMQMAARQRRVIVIDPGHGGRDPGARGAGRGRAGARQRARGADLVHVAALHPARRAAEPRARPRLRVSDGDGGARRAAPAHAA